MMQHDEASRGGRDESKVHAHRKGDDARPVLETGDAVEEFESTRGAALLWFGFLGSAIAWLLHLSLSYILVGYACDYGVQPLVHLPSVLMLVMTAAAGWVSWLSWGRLGRSTEEEVEGPEGRSRFMAMSGVVMAVFFGLVIIAQWIPAFIMPPCY
jgi:hypothetical protein